MKLEQTTVMQKYTFIGVEFILKKSSKREWNSELSVAESSFHLTENYPSAFLR